MGLFGHSWEWEEWERKEAIMGDIRRENDRILASQRSEHDRLMRDANAKPKFIIDRFRKEKNIEYHTNIRSQIATGKYIKALFTWNKGSDYAWLLKWTCIVFVLFSIVGLAFMPTDYLQYVFPFMLLVIFLYLFIKTLKYIPFSIITSSKLQKNKCYKGILEQVKQEDLKQIKYIAINKEKIRIVNNENIKKDFCYSQYNYPELDIKRQPIFIGKLLKDLKINTRFKIVVSSFQKDINIFETNELKDNGLGIYDYSKCIIAENKNNKVKTKLNKENINKW